MDDADADIRKFVYYILYIYKYNSRRIKHF